MKSPKKHPSLHCLKSGTQLGLLITPAIAGLIWGSDAQAQALTTTGPSLSSDTFQQIDANGVDVINGTYHIQAPALTAGGEANTLSGELRWNGRMWELNIPSIWTDGDRNLFVNNGQRVDEFDFTSGVGWVPLRGDGSTLDCTFWDSDRKVMSSCNYLSHEGIRIYFNAPSPYSVAPPNFAPALGNVNASQFLAFYPGGRALNAYSTGSGGLDLHSNLGYGMRLTNVADPAVGLYLLTDDKSPTAISSTGVYQAVVTSMMIATPGISSSTRNDKNMLRPKSTTQSMTDALNRTWSFSFNADGDMTGVRRPTSAGNNLTLGYDGDHRVTSFNNGFATWYYSYSSSGSNGTTDITDPNGGHTIVTYVKKKGYARSITDPLNRLTTYDYDSNSRVKTITYPELNSVAYTYDARGNVTSKTSYPKPGSALAPLVVEAGYDSSCAAPNNQMKCNLPIYIIDARHNRTDIAYNPWGQPLTITKPAAVAGGVRPQTRMTYNWLNVRVRDADGTIAVNTDQLSMLMSTSECRTLASCDGLADEVKTTIDYGPLDNTTANYLLPRSISTGAGDGSLTAVVAKTYDGRGNLISEDGPLPGTGDTTVNRYDAMRQLVGTVLPDPDGATQPLPAIATRTTYNADGQPTLVEKGTVPDQTDSGWAQFNTLQRAGTSYDSLGRVRAVATAGTGATQTVTETAYDTFGRPQCVAIRMNQATFPTIASDGSLVGGALGGSACIPDVSGTGGPDRVTVNTYDAVGNLTSVQKAVGTPQAQFYARYEYNPAGKQISLTDANGNLATMSYDGFDRQNKWTFPSLTTPGVVNPADYEFYTYDENGNRTSLRKRDGRTIGYTYDLLDRVSVKTIDGTCVSTACTTPPADAARSVYYAYDLRGAQTEAHFDSLAGNDAVINSYDALGRITDSTTKMGGTARTIGHQYELNGARRRTTWPDQQFITYHNDLLGRPDWLYEGTSGTLANIGYYPIGNRYFTSRISGLNSVYYYDTTPRLAAIAHDFVGTASDVTFGFPAYNAAGQITTRSRDNNAYALSGYAPGTKNYTVNGLNQYAAVDGTAFDYDGNGNLKSTGATTLVYDVENRLVKANGGLDARLTYDAMGRLFQVANNAGTGVTQFLYDGDELAAEYDAGGAMTARYVHGNGEDDPMVWYNGATMGDSTRRFLHEDQQGSIIAVSDAVGNNLAHNSYDEYGVAGGENIGRFQYTGQIYLPEIAMYYYKARIYSAKLGRFLQTDPIGYKDQVDLYAYVGDDPTNGSDPTGLSDVRYTSKYDAPEIRAAGDSFDIPGAITVVSHGAPFALTTNYEHYQRIPAARVAEDIRDYIRSHGGNQPIIVLGCRMASDGLSSARELSGRLGRPVMASTSQVAWSQNGDVITARAFWKGADGHADRSKPGEFKVIGGNFTDYGIVVPSGMHVNGFSFNIRTKQSQVIFSDTAVDKLDFGSNFKMFTFKDFIK